MVPGPSPIFEFMLAAGSQQCQSAHPIAALVRQPATLLPRHRARYELAPFHSITSSAAIRRMGRYWNIGAVKIGLIPL
jgi:hypothetical protein